MPNVLRITLVFALLPALMVAQSLSSKLEPIDIFDIELVSDAQISADGDRILFVRSYKDIMTDANLSNIYLMNFDGSQLRPVTTGNQLDVTPRWSPDGKRMAYRSNKDGSMQIYVRWVEEGIEQKLTNTTRSPGTPYWSPDGTVLAFSMQVPFEPETFVRMPAKPEGAKWNDPPRVVDRMKYRSDGSGYEPDAYSQIFVVTADGGSAIQLTDDPWDHDGRLTWSPDGAYLYYSANGHEDRHDNPANTEIYRLDVKQRSAVAITNREGPDHSPALSADGSKMAYLGYDEQYQGYQVTRLYVSNADGSLAQCISCDFDRQVSNIHWSADGRHVYFQYDDQGNGKIGRMAMNGESVVLADNLGGLSLGRPYGGGVYSVAQDGRFAFTHSTPDHPADLAAGTGSDDVKRLTRLNDDLLQYKKLGEVEEIWYKSSHDNLDIQGWICKPPDFDPSKKYPLILEIHGGPFANYGDRFSAEVQLYAAAGYVVLYTNPRGSSSYGEQFGNLIHHNYPGEDYDDLIAGVDALIDRGYIDADRLYVTGGSGGGVLSSWIVGKTDRFKAAVVAKPVINWYSFVLYADNPAFFYRYWFPGKPWDHLEHYMRRSPISLVGNVKTPTMLLTGEADLRTPMAETEQYYAALKINGVDTKMVRVPGAGHGIANRPSNLIAKVLHILGWFDKYQ